MNLLRLPTEIIVEILLLLDVPDAYAVQALNRFFHDLYKTSLDLQYALECKIAHVRDNPNCHLPIPERLQMLRDRESAWSSLTPTSKRTITLPTIPEEYIAGSGYLELQPNHCTLYRYLGFGGSMLRKFFQISPIREIKESSFHSVQVGDMVHAGYCIDEHDLIACLTRGYLPDSQIELRLVLLQYSTGNSHPLAMEPNILVCHDAVSNMRFKFVASTIEIFGENLVLTVSVRAGAELGWMYVYNWKTGKAKCEPIRVSNTDIIVLDHNLVIIPDSIEWSLNIFYIPSSSSGGSVKVIQEFKLPPFNSSRNILIRCRSLPNPTDDGRFPQHVSSSIPFMDQPDTALIRITLPGPASMLVHRHSIMKLLPPPEDWPAVMKPLTLYWDSWGPPVTAIQSGVTTTYGQRSIHSSDSGLRSHDFNIYHVRRSVKTKQPDPYGPYYLADPVTTGMPCVKIVSPTQKFSGAYIADGTVIGMKKNTTTIEVLYFSH